MYLNSMFKKIGLSSGSWGLSKKNHPKGLIQSQNENFWAKSLGFDKKFVNYFGFTSHSMSYFKLTLRLAPSEIDKLGITRRVRFKRLFMMHLIFTH